MTSSTSPSHNYPACLADMSAATLFIGELMPHVNEVILYKKFAPMGTVTSVKLCRDWITGKSLCYAYVNFENPAEAEKAYRTLNYELLEGQPMRIMKSTRNPWLENNRDVDGCCYHRHHHHHRCCSGGGGGGGGGGSGGGGGGIGGGGVGGKELMDPHILVEAIESYSRALKDTDENKGPTGYKYSKEFLKRMNIANDQFTNVFIKNFKDLLDDYKLYRLCKPFGEVTSAKVMVDEYGISKGFGFACFTDSDAAQRAVNKLNGLMLDGRTLYAGPALTKGERTKDWGNTRNDYDNNNYNKQLPPSPHVSISPRICIRNLRDVVDEVRLRKEFERFGPVQQVELLMDNEGRSKGTGYVMYEDQTDAFKAVNSMNGKMIYGTRIGVNYVPYTATAATNTNPDTFLMANSHSHHNRNHQHHHHSHHSNSNSMDNSDGHNNDDINRSWENDKDSNNRSHGKDSGDNKENIGGSGGSGGGGSGGSGGGSGGGGGSCGNTSQQQQVYLQFKDLATSLAHRGHPINIKDIDKRFGNNATSNSVNRNASNNSEMNTSNNAVKVVSASSSMESSTSEAHHHHQQHNQRRSSSCSTTTTSRQIRRKKDIMDNNNNDIDNDSYKIKTKTTTTATMTMKVNADNEEEEEEEDVEEEEVNEDSDADDTRSGKATLLVKNLDESITDYKLESLFNVYGTVVSANVVSSEFGVSKGFGFVIMAEAQDAVKAIKNLDGRIVVNRPIYISPTAQTKLSTH